MNRFSYLRQLVATWAAATISLGFHAVAQAQTPVGDYQFQSVYTSTGGTLGALTPINPASLSFVTATVNGQSQTVLQAGASNNTGTASTIQGGVQTPANPFADGSTYTIALLASFTLNPANVGATKVFDFKGLTTDAGLYINATTGAIQFIDGTGTVIAGATGVNPALASTYFLLTLTRTAAGVVTAYNNGNQAFQFTDINALATVSNVLTLFVDDGTGIGGTVVNEGTDGNLARLLLYNDVLTQGQVAALAVPEPSALVWAAVGLLSAGVWLRNRCAA